MQPNEQLITIHNNEEKIVNLLNELVLQPRLKALQWSGITKQTPNMKIGYPGQHLASLITGIEGARTGARGDDLRDGTEVKSCSRVDQLDSCISCNNKVLRIENSCHHCGSNRIKRMDDSKWLFSVKSEAELSLLTETIDRIFLTIADYPFFDSNDFETIRFQAFEIWNKTERHKHFSTLMSNYYYKLFLEHIKLNPKATPAPKNFWPYSYQFYLCNPVKVFTCTVKEANSSPKISIDYYVPPNADRAKLSAENMPTLLINQDELQMIMNNAPKDVILKQIKSPELYEQLNQIIFSKKMSKSELIKLMPSIDEELRCYLDLRDTDVISKSKETYARRK